MIKKEIKKLGVLFSLLLLNIIIISRNLQNFSNLKFLTKDIQLFNQTIITNDYKAQIINSFYMTKDLDIFLIIFSIILLFILIDIFFNDFYKIRGEKCQKH